MGLEGETERRGGIEAEQGQQTCLAERSKLNKIKKIFKWRMRERENHER